MPYSPSQIDNLVHTKLMEFFPEERLLCNLGWVSLKNPGIKYRPQFLNSFNFATKVDEIDYISQFARDADLDAVREFYRQTNGMRLLCDKFIVPGVLFHRKGFSQLDFYCVALDFTNHGGFRLPTFSPETGLQIGISYRESNGTEEKIYDILTKSGEIIGGYFDVDPKVTDRFENTHDWLSARIAGAAQELRNDIAQLQL